MSWSKSLRSFIIWSSSRIRGNELTKPADNSCATAVELNVWMYFPISGLAHTDAASINPTVLPVSVPPQTWTKKGRHEHGSTSTEANAATNKILGAGLSPLRISFARSIHFLLLPFCFTLLKKDLKASSPSNTSPST